MKYPAGFYHLILPFALFFTYHGSYEMQRDRNQEKQCGELSAGQKGFIQLVHNDEQCVPLLIYGKIIDRKTNRPVNNASIFLYHTDNKGIYNNSGRDEDARIRGTVHTNESGCFKIKTILPGDYPGQKNSRHLHYVITAKGYTEKKSILFFKGFTTANITEQGPLIVLDIHKDGKGNWVGSTNIDLEQGNK